MASARYDHGLLYLLFLIILPYAFGALVAIHNGHAAVHEDQAVGAAISAGVFDNIESILTIRCSIYEVCDFAIALIHNIGSI